VNGTIHATSAHKAGVSGIDDGIGIHLRNIAPRDREPPAVDDFLGVITHIIHPLFIPGW
jgi:hypothetical protein